MNEGKYSSHYFEKAKATQARLSLFLTLSGSIVAAFIPIILSVLLISKTSGTTTTAEDVNEFNLSSSSQFDLTGSFFANTETIIAVIIAGCLVGVLIIAVSLYLRLKYQEYMAKYVHASIVEYCYWFDPGVICTFDANETSAKTCDEHTPQRLWEFYLRVKQESQFSDRDILNAFYEYFNHLYPRETIALLKDNLHSLRYKRTYRTVYGELELKVSNMNCSCTFTTSKQGLKALEQRKETLESVTITFTYYNSHDNRSISVDCIPGKSEPVEFTFGEPHYIHLSYHLKSGNVKIEIYPFNSTPKEQKRIRRRNVKCNCSAPCQTSGVFRLKPS